jgi:hypothetical protein
MCFSQNKETNDRNRYRGCSALSESLLSSKHSDGRPLSSLTGKLWLKVFGFNRRDRVLDNGGAHVRLLATFGADNDSSGQEVDYLMPKPVRIDAYNLQLLEPFLNRGDGLLQRRCPSRNPNPIDPIEPAGPQFCCAFDMKAAFTGCLACF